MLKQVLLVCVLGSSILGLNACSRNDTPPQQVQQYAPQPIVIQQAAQPDDNDHELLSAGLGAAAGYALAKQTSTSVAPKVVHKTVIVKQYVPAKRPAAYAPRYATPSYNTYKPRSSSSSSKVSFTKSKR